jgi:flagellar hook-associated protein 1 FlgK
MSLTGALNIGKTALTTSQAMLQVTGNNIANAGNADYTRQVGKVVTTRDRMLKPGVFMGTGVNLQSITRQIDEALESRIRGSISDSSAADSSQQWLGRVEAVFNELTDTDLSTALSTFFNAWSNLANKPQDMGLRQIVLQDGAAVASRFRDLRQQLESLIGDVDDRLQALTLDADALAEQIADLNRQITAAEGGTGGTANGLRDQRDALLKELSKLIDVTTVNDRSITNVFVGSEPLVQLDQNRGIELTTESVDGAIEASLIFRANNGTMTVTSGALGSLMSVRERLTGVIEEVDRLAGALMFEVNKLHSSGQGVAAFSNVNATATVDDADAVLNTKAAGLDFTPTNGSFVVHVKHKATGQTVSTLVNVDLDGLGGNDTTLNTLRAELDAIDGVSAVVSSGGQLRLSADTTDIEISFSQDNSGVLAALGINTFFAGSDARDIAVSETVKNNPSLLAAARNGQPGDNQTALAIASLETRALDALGGTSLKQTYEQMINAVAVQAAEARTTSEAARVINETLMAQRELLSGVSLDEEAINLMKYQRAYQAAARVVAAIDELMQTMLTMVR